MYRDQEISVILVDDDDVQIGYGDKLEVHRTGLLHRAFSIFLFNNQGELLIQKRAESKYCSGNVWTNTCCGHPFPGEDATEAAHRRLHEELGFFCDLEPLTHLYYRQELEHGMIEHEYIHMFKGIYENQPIYPDPNEVAECAWRSPEFLRQNCKTHPEHYAGWFCYYLNHHYNQLFE